MSASRDAAWQALATREGPGPRFDVLVVGGGIAGAGVALEAARSHARVALVEARDFASGTSSRSSKLVHGGLRYIAQGHFGLTRESVRERDALLRDAQGLVWPLPFLLPVRDGDKNGRRKVGIGLALYDLFAGRRTRAWFDAQALHERVPGLSDQGLQGGWTYLDAQTDDARLVQRVLAEAQALGAVCVNYARVERLLRGAGDGAGPGRVQGAVVHDVVGDRQVELQAACVINATGAWADTLRGQLGRAPRLRPLRGSHLMLPGWRLPLAQAFAFFHPDDGRPVFALPWEGATLVGTTDLDHHESLDHEPAISRAEFAYLMRALQAQFRSLGLQARDVVSTMAGVRPVVASGQAVDPSKEGREHLIVEEDGLVTVTGGKLTTFRPMALQALALAARDVPVLRDPAERTREEARCWVDWPPAVFDDSPPVSGLPPALTSHWRARYGAHAAQVRDIAQPGELQRIGSTDTTWADLRWACQAEQVVHLDDLLLRRTRLGLLLPRGGEALLDRVQAIVQATLGWSEAHWRGERQRYLALIDACYGVPAQVEGA